MLHTTAAAVTIKVQAVWIVLHAGIFFSFFCK